jgi:hypothetical protein
MTVVKTTALVSAFVGAVALGVAISPTVRDTWSERKAPVATAATSDDADAMAASKAPEGNVAKKESRGRRAPSAEKAEAAPDTLAPRMEPGSIRTVAVSVWEPELRDRVKEVLMPGAKPEIAADDFASAEQFMMVAHAARNTRVPFMVLKHGVLYDGLTLADAIDKFKPELDAKAEVERARAAARADLGIAG